MADKKRILLIDNEAGLCRMMEQILLDHGYLARSFTSPHQAVEEFKASAWDLVISDIKMPGMSGLEVLQAIKAKQHGGQAGIPDLNTVELFLKQQQHS